MGLILCAGLWVWAQVWATASLNSNKVSFSLYKYLKANLWFEPQNLSLWEKKRAQNLLKNNSILAKNMGQARDQPRDGPSTAKNPEEFSEKRRIHSTTAEQFKYLQRNSYLSENQNP